MFEGYLQRYVTALTFAPGALIVYTLKGSGKNDSEAGAVRSNYPIPISCGIYYYEVLIVSKGRDGYADVVKPIFQKRLTEY
jgi:hypothetical protein